VIFGIVETKVAEPLFRLSLFRIRAFAAGNIANLMVALGRGGMQFMQFMLIIWLQGIWLPLPSQPRSASREVSGPADRHRLPGVLKRLVLRPAGWP
jgi:hypothetical protein